MYQRYDLKSKSASSRVDLQVSEEQASKVGVQTLVTRDQLVGECETRHKTSLLEPEDGCLLWKGK